MLVVDGNTLVKRLAAPPANEWGGHASEQVFIAGQHATKEDIHQGSIVIDAMQPLSVVVDVILELISS